MLQLSMPVKVMCVCVCVDSITIMHKMFLVFVGWLYTYKVVQKV